jgi:hypothetical protein
VTVRVGDPPERVPLAVWPRVQTSAQYLRTSSCLPACIGHPGKMLPELARRSLVGIAEVPAGSRGNANQESAATATWEETVWTSC